jgi:hypothetical protein
MDQGSLFALNGCQAQENEVEFFEITPFPQSPDLYRPLLKKPIHPVPSQDLSANKAWINFNDRSIIV